MHAPDRPQTYAHPARLILILSLAPTVGLGIGRFAYALVLPDMRDTLGLFEPSLAFLQVTRHQLQGFLRAFAIFDVGRDPIPLDDVSIFISERHSTVQLPSILPIRAARTHLIFVRLARSNRFHPFTCMSLKIIRVN